MKQYYKHINIPKEKKLYEGVDAFTNLLIGKSKSLFYSSSKLKKDAKEIFDLSLEYASLSEEELDEKVLEYQGKFRLNKVDDLELIKAFAIVVELGFRQTDKRAYVVQIMGALALVKKFLIEMSTGEGKTLTASLAAVILAWKGKPVHVLTSNDYLASRDSKLLEVFYERANLSVGYVIGSTSPELRKEIYQRDLVYSTGKEILADFLKDRMKEEKNFNINSFLLKKLSNKPRPSDYLIRGLDSVIVDEADSVLSDDAVTPLIISNKAENKILRESVVDAYEIAKYLKEDEHYTITEKFNDINFNDEALDIIERNSRRLSTIWRVKDRREFLIKQALMARELYILNKHYIVRDGKVIIVDEKTGRVMAERSWGNGLHQAIEVKEGLEITDPTVTFAKMSFQRFFRLYEHLCGMSGTLQNLKGEFWQIYSLQTVRIPTRVPSKMNILKDKIFFDKKEKEEALIEYIKDLNEKKLPVLVGITTIKDSQSLANKLEKYGVSCTLLNALNDEIEAQIIEKAGDLGKITIATNMAGRGTDIHIPKDVEKLGGLQVITTQRDKSRRIDLQFFGRCARQGQKGTAVAFLALDDAILKNYTPVWLMKILSNSFGSAFIKKLSNLLYIFYQRKIEGDISKLRNKTLQRDLSTDDSMSFTN